MYSGRKKSFVILFLCRRGGINIISPKIGSIMESALYGFNGYRKSPLRVSLMCCLKLGFGLGEVQLIFDSQQRCCF